MLNWSGLVNAIWIFTRKRGPDILTGIGIAGMFSAGAMAVRATPKALDIIEKAKAESEQPTTIEIVKATWTCYIPSVALGILSAGCLLGASSANVRRNTALATAYSLSESAFKEYQTKVVEHIGERKEKGVRDAVAQDQLQRNPVTTREVFITGKGNTLWYDPLIDRYFRFDVDRLKKIENELNRRMRTDMCISLNDLYYEIGLKEVDLGNALGWNIDRGYIDITFNPGKATDDTPCLVLGFTPDGAPKYDFRK